jgi:hypothetical protein
MRRVRQFGWAVLLLGSTAGLRGAEADGPVRKRFAEVEAAVKAKDADKLWALLSSKTRAQAEKEAKAIREAYARAGPGERAAQEKDLGLSGAELAKLTGKGLLKGKPCLRRYGELVGSTVTRVVMEKDSARVEYTEPDGDKEKLVFLREGGEWKAWLTVPKAKKP